MCKYCCQMTAVVTIGFVKDAKHHIDVQGFNVYHKNRLIKVRVVLAEIAMALLELLCVVDANFKSSVATLLAVTDGWTK